MFNKVETEVTIDKPYLSPASFNRKNKTLTEAQAMHIKVLLSKGRSKTSIARSFKVTYNTILAISSGKAWASLDATARIAELSLPASVWGD